MYVCVGRKECQFAVLLRNVNLRSHSECQFVLTAGYLIRALHDNVGTTFLGDGRWVGQRG